MNDIEKKTAAENVVLAFGRAWEAQSPDKIIEMLATDIVYQNVPLPEMIGHDAVRNFITPGLLGAKGIKWEFLANVGSLDGRRVLTERVDTFIFDNGSVPVPLMGIFEIENGLISKWRDYADIGEFVRGMKALGR